MAGYLDAEALGNFATIGAKFILIDKLLKEQNASFETDPDGCFRVLVIEFLNVSYLNALAEKHADFLPIANAFCQAFMDGSIHPTDYYAELFESSLKLLVTEPYKYDADFNVMMATIINTFFSKEVRQEHGRGFFGLFEQCECETYWTTNVLLACALWGADYENFREITMNKYYELKTQGFDESDEKTEISSDHKTQPTVQIVVPHQ